VNFAFSLLILAAFLVYYARPVSAGELAWLPVIVFVQLTFTLGLSLLLSSLTVHFRDLRDLVANLLTLWFWGTPIIYSIAQAPERFHRLLGLNPLTHLMVAYQSVLFLDGPYDGWPALLWLGAAVPGAAGRGLLRVRSAPRYAGRGSLMHAVEVRDVRKIYRRYGRRKSFGTLKSALLSGGVLRNLSLTPPFSRSTA
jgi:ABC-type multidrug transport system permease subunit